MQPSGHHLDGLVFVDATCLLESRPCRVHRLVDHRDHYHHHRHGHDEGTAHGARLCGVMVQGEEGARHTDMAEQDSEQEDKVVGGQRP